MTNIEILNPRQYLTDELARRCSKNSRYSLRTFAQFLELTPSALSMILSGKRSISKKTAQKVVTRLGLNPEVKRAFLNGCGQIQNLDFQDDPGSEYQSIEFDKYEVVADWYHFGILSLIETTDFVPKPSWIADRLGITLAEAKAALDRLLRVGLLDTSGSKWKQSGKPIKMENTISTAATRKHQEQLLKKALESLEQDPIQVREISSMTLAIDPQLIPQAVIEIRKFRRKLTKLLEGSGPAKEVYELTVQLFPVSKRK